LTAVGRQRQRAVTHGGAWATFARIAVGLAGVLGLVVAVVAAPTAVWIAMLAIAAAGLVGMLVGRHSAETALRTSVGIALDELAARELADQDRAPSASPKE
jgi:hypothetical protein